MKCSLCGSKTVLFYTIQKKNYLRCTLCKGVLLHPTHFLSKTAEKNRYLKHNNDISDSGYQQFVSPILNAVTHTYSKEDYGLDFGSGSSSIITVLLTKQGYDVIPYDPYFNQNEEVLKKRYHYIICCEVMEHFHHPAKEFEALYSLLKPNGVLYCKTNVYDDAIDFNSWWYKNDTTHVFFYTKETLLWIQSYFGFKKVVITKDLISFQK